LKAPHDTPGVDSARPSSELRPAPDEIGAADRFYWVTILSVTGITLVLHVLGALQPRGPFWGVHHYAFFPTAVLISSLAAVLIGSYLSFRLPGPAKSPSNSLSRPETIESWKVAVGGMALGVMGLSLFWIFRTGHLFLGDGFAIVGGLSHGSGFHPYEPLSISLLELVYQSVEPFVGTDGPSFAPAWRAAALASAVAGAVFVPILYGLSREVCQLGSHGSRNWASSGVVVALVFLGLLAQGYIQLFFGYVEVYGFLTVGIAGYLWAALRHLQGRAPLWAPSLLLALTIAFHLSAAVLVPSLLVLAIRSLRAVTPVCQIVEKRLYPSPRTMSPAATAENAPTERARSRIAGPR